MGNYYFFYSTAAAAIAIKNKSVLLLGIYLKCKKISAMRWR
jgi:hypothetical protein